MPPGESLRGEREEESGDWTDALAYEGDAEVASPERDGNPEHWDRWHYGIYLGAALLLVGALEGALLPLAAGYAIVPPAMYLDSRYLDSVTTGWQSDVGLYVVGSLLFPVLMVPVYLYRRRELRSG